MSNFYVNLGLLILVAAGMALLLFKVKNFSKSNVIIVISLIMFWTLMYMQKTSPINKEKISHDLGKWTWPIVASLYQLMQVATRIPYGKLSQKLKSRNNIIQIAFGFILIALIMMVVSHLETWSLIIGAMAMGQFGATFGLDSQYVSENYNIKKVFTSSSIVFIIPVIGSLIASTMYAGFKGMNSFTTETYYWMIVATLGLGFMALVSYSLIKEDKSTIRLDNVDPSTKVFVKRNGRDVAAVSITAGFLAFVYNFTLSFGTQVGELGYWSSVISVAGLGASVLIGIVLKKYVSGKLIRTLSLSLLGIATMTAGTLFIVGAMTLVAWVVLMVLVSISFGMYVMALFGAALHFDHKFPALVLGIFLTVKSFTLGTSTLISGLIYTATDSKETIGIVIIVLSAVGIFATLMSSMFIVNRFKDNDVDKLINDSFKYELNSSKVVVSKKIVKNL